MLDHALLFLRDALQTHLRAQDRTEPAGSPEARVVFPSGTSPSPEIDAITCVLVGAENEAIASGVASRMEGERARSTPPVHLNLHVLFVSHFSAYEHSLRALSRVSAFFEGTPLFTGATTAGLSSEILRLSVEPLALSLPDQAAMWAMLQTTHQPSRLYKVRVLEAQPDASAVLPRIADANAG